MTSVDRTTCCIVGVAGVWERSAEALQTLLDHSVGLPGPPIASDAFKLYLSGIYAGTH